MKNVVITTPFSQHEYEVEVTKWTVLPSGYGHKEVVLRVKVNATNQADTECNIHGDKHFKYVTSDLDFFDNLPEVHDRHDADANDLAIIDRFLDEEEVGEWVERLEDESSENKIVFPNE